MYLLLYMDGRHKKDNDNASSSGGRTCIVTRKFFPGTECPLQSHYVCYTNRAEVKKKNIYIKYSKCYSTRVSRTCCTTSSVGFNYLSDACLSLSTSPCVAVHRKPRRALSAFMFAEHVCTVREMKPSSRHGRCSRKVDVVSDSLRVPVHRPSVHTSRRVRIFFYMLLLLLLILSLSSLFNNNTRNTRRNVNASESVDARAR